MEKHIDNIIHWDSGIFNDPVFLPYTDSRQFAAWNLHRKRIEIVFETLKNLENLPITFQSTKEILDGDYAEDIDIESYLAIKDYATAFDDLCQSVLNGNFLFSKSDACHVHAMASRHQLELSASGIFRNGQVRLGSVKWLPPESRFLGNIWKNGGEKTSEIKNPAEKGIIAFLWMSRCQFFFDCNKRTALLMANGILASAGCVPLIFDSNDQKYFMNLLSIYYETGDANNMIGICAKYMQHQKKMIKKSPKM